jgi:isocitrate dehydrogenase
LKTISNRGIAVYPGVDRDIFCSDHWSCRFVSPDYATSEGSANIEKNLIIELLKNINNAGLDFIKTENIYNFSGARAYSLAQGEVS